MEVTLSVGHGMVVAPVTLNELSLHSTAF